MKVLFFYPNEFIGPEMTVYAQIIRHLDRTHFEPYLALNSEAEGDMKLSEADGVIIKRWKFGYGFAAAQHRRYAPGRGFQSVSPRLRGYIRRERIDIIQCSAVPRVGRWLCRWPGCPAPGCYCTTM